MGIFRLRDNSYFSFVIVFFGSGRSYGLFPVVSKCDAAAAAESGCGSRSICDTLSKMVALALPLAVKGCFRLYYMGMELCRKQGTMERCYLYDRKGRQNKQIRRKTALRMIVLCYLYHFRGCSRLAVFSVFII